MRTKTTIIQALIPTVVLVLSILITGPVASAEPTENTQAASQECADVAEAASIEFERFPGEVPSNVAAPYLAMIWEDCFSSYLEPDSSTTNVDANVDAPGSPGDTAGFQSSSSTGCMGTPAAGLITLELSVYPPHDPREPIELDLLADGGIGSMTHDSRGEQVDLIGSVLGLSTSLDLAFIAKVPVPVVLAYANVICGEVDADFCVKEVCIDAGTEITCSGQGVGAQFVPGVWLRWKSNAISAYPCSIDLPGLGDVCEKSSLCQLPPVPDPEDPCESGEFVNCQPPIDPGCQLCALKKLLSGVGNPKDFVAPGDDIVPLEFK